MPIPSATLLLQRIAADLSSGDVVFPTCFNITLKVRDLLRDPDVGLDDLARVLQTEPIISSRLMRMANSAALAPAGGAVKDLGMALMRLGMESVKSVAFSVAMEQLARSKHMSAYTDLSSRIWEHSILVAAIARVLARETRRARPDEAFFAGLVHDIGAFYLLYYACEDATLKDDREAVLDLMLGWHDGIGHALLDALGQQSEELLYAVQNHESTAPLEHLTGLADILRAANVLANRTCSWHAREEADDALVHYAGAEDLDDLLAQSQAEAAELQASLRG